MWGLSGVMGEENVAGVGNGLQARCEGPSRAWWEDAERALAGEENRSHSDHTRSDDHRVAGPPIAAFGYCAGDHHLERRISGDGSAKSRGRDPSISGSRMIDGPMSFCR